MADAVDVIEVGVLFAEDAKNGWAGNSLHLVDEGSSITRGLPLT
jgi:hypothetical protein